MDFLKTVFSWFSWAAQLGSVNGWLTEGVVSWPVGSLHIIVALWNEVKYHTVYSWNSVNIFFYKIHISPDTGVNDGVWRWGPLSSADQRRSGGIYIMSWQRSLTDTCIGVLC